MKLVSKKLDIITITAIVLMAISISLLDFNDLSWEKNAKSYIGIILFLLLIVVKYIMLSKSKK